MIKKFLMAAAFFALPSASMAIDGVYKTESGETGGYLLVQVGDCADKVCGTIVDVVSGEGVSAKDHAWLNKRIIWGMNAKGDNKWSGGKIWAPDQDKTYSSKMQLNGTELKVSGCVAAVLCRSQVWTKQ